MALPLGSAPSIILGVGLGAAASTAIEPVVESARQTAWKNNPVRILTPDLYAQLVAQGAITLDNGRIQAHLEGLNDDKFDGLVHLALTTPTYAEAQDLRRRDKITPDQLRHTFAKAQIEQQYWDALADIVDERLSAQAVALGIIRSVINDPGFFPVNLDTSGGVIPAYPVSDIDAIKEAAASGFDKERLRVMVASIGRPPGPGELARALFRGLIQRPDANRGILEGDTRPEWADTFIDINREILTASQYAELQLRGFLTATERLAETDKHGMSKADSDLLYNLLGRSIPVHQITTGLARGGQYEGPIDTIPRSYLSSLRRGNLRPEYYNLAYANRYSLPSAFVFRFLLQDGTLTAAEGETYFKQLGWPPDLAKTVAAAYGTRTGTAKPDPHVTKAQNQVWTRTHSSYVAGEITRTVARNTLGVAGVATTALTQILDLWDAEKGLIRKQLTPAQIKKAYKKGSRNAATGSAWTRDEALAALVELGYAPLAANDFLDIP